MEDARDRGGEEQRGHEEKVMRGTEEARDRGYDL